MNPTEKFKNIKGSLASRPYLQRAMVYSYNFVSLYMRLLLNILRFKYPVNKKSLFQSRRPKILQFPITSRCNLNCKMCGLENDTKMDDISPDQFLDIFQNPIFKNIRSVGINGGEPFLQKNLVSYVNTLFPSFPKLRNIYLISNGTVTSAMLANLPIIADACSKNKVKLTFSISLDGIHEIHDLVRGRMGTFSTVEKVCPMIKENQDKYCDEFGLLCTVTKHNIYEINELDVWCKLNGYNISYNLATQHMRLNTKSLEDDFTVFADEHTKLIAAEFFYSKFIETKSAFYFALYKFISESERATGCDFKYDGITILADGSVAYCATKSKILGNALLDKADKLFNNNREYRNLLIRESCQECSHYTNALLFGKQLEYNREILRMIGTPFKFR